MSLKNNVGRSLIFTNPEDLQHAVNKYFEDCDNHVIEVMNKAGELVRVVEPDPYTMSGLANALKMNRNTLIEYGKGNYKSVDDETNQAFIEIIRDARARVEEYAERSLYILRNPAGAIFNLKNNFGWVDRQEISSSGQPERITKSEIDALLEEEDDEPKRITTSDINKFLDEN